MRRKTSILLLVFLITLLVSVGVTIPFALARFIRDDNLSKPEPITRFYVINESEISIGKPEVFYRIILENQEGTTVNYEMKVQAAGKIVFNEEMQLNSSKILNKTISLNPNFTGEYMKLEFLLYKDNEIYRSRVFQVAPAAGYNYTSIRITNITKNEAKKTREEMGAKEPYIKQKNGNIIMYTFNSGEKLDLKVQDYNVSIGDAVYTTAAKEDNIIFLGETYEKILLDTANYLYPIITDMKDIKVKVNENFKLKNGYTFTLMDVKDKNLKIRVFENKIARDIISTENSTIQYWKMEDGYKTQKTIQIYPKNTSQDELVLDVKQYGGKKVILVGNKYGEFQVTNVTIDSITMKNIQPIEIEPEKEITLINGKIKIKV